MLNLQYSKVVQQKLRELKSYLVQVSGEKRGTIMLRKGPLLLQSCMITVKIMQINSSMAERQMMMRNFLDG